MDSEASASCRSPDCHEWPMLCKTTKLQDVARQFSRSSFEGCLASPWSFNSHKTNTFNSCTIQALFHTNHDKKTHVTHVGTGTDNPTGVVTPRSNSNTREFNPQLCINQTVL